MTGWGRSGQQLFFAEGLLAITVCLEELVEGHLILVLLVVDVDVILLLDTV